MKVQTRFSLGIIIVFGLLAALIVAMGTSTRAVMWYLLVAVAGIVICLLVTFLVMMSDTGGRHGAAGRDSTASRDSTADIQRLLEASGRIASGDLSHRVAVESKDELGELAASFNEMAAGLEVQRREIERNQRELEALNAELSAINHNYMEMLGFVAHELKNPLASAVMSLHTVSDGYLGQITPAQKKSLGTVAQSLEYFQDMIKNYLDLSRLEKGELEVTRTYIPLHARVVHPVLEGLEGELLSRKVLVEDRIPQGKVVYADANLLRIGYDNLLVNAIKYGLEGGTIVLDAREDAGSVILSVCNDGAGIPHDKLPLLFRKFSRLHCPEHAGKRGTGLGLYICREIIEKHGGSIWADSQMGEWVRFGFSLPRGGNLGPVADSMEVADPVAADREVRCEGSDRGEKKVRTRRSDHV